MCTIIRLKDNINEIHGEINRKSEDLKCVHNIWSGLMIPQIAFRISYNFYLLCLSCSPLYFSINNAAMKISLHEYPISVISMHTFTISSMLWMLYWSVFNYVATLCFIRKSMLKLCWHDMSVCHAILMYLAQTYVHSYIAIILNLWTDYEGLNKGQWVHLNLFI